MSSWLRENWSYVLSWSGFICGIIIAIRAVYAAKLDRQALQSADLERRKLALEVARLQNSPEIVADRRTIYERLRRFLFSIAPSAELESGDIGILHEIRHDSTFRYPDEIVESIDALIDSAIELHISGKEVQRGPHRVSDDEWRMIVNRNSGALLQLVEYGGGMRERFRPYLTL